MRVRSSAGFRGTFGLILIPAALAYGCGGGSSGDDDDDAGASGAPASGGTNGTNAGRGGRGGTSATQGGSGGTGLIGAAGDDTGAKGGSTAAGRGGSTGVGTGGGIGESGSDAVGNGGTGVGGTGGSGGGGVTGAVPAELVGVWQETRASGGTYESAYGSTFEVTSGFSVQLKISSNGAYYFAHFAEGASIDCQTVSYFDQSVGTVVLDGNVLTFHPSERRLDITDCADSGSQDLPNDPFSFDVSLEESNHYYGGLRTYKMHMEGGAQPLDVTLLVRPPVAEPTEPAQPDGFALGTVGPFQELQGLWVPSPGTDTGFFDPSTGEAYLPELNGSPHQWLRFEGDAYETAVALQTINAEGVCKADVIYYEQGKGLFQVTEDVGGQGTHFVGDVRLEATAARLIVNVRECDEDDFVYQYDVEPLLSYYRFIYFTTAQPPESFALICDFPLSEWQSLLCTNTPSFSRRE